MKNLSYGDCSYHNVDPCKVYGATFNNGAGVYVLMFEGDEADRTPSYMSKENAQHAVENLSVGDLDPTLRMMVRLGMV